MEYIGLSLFLLSSTQLSAEAMPGINSYGGATVLPQGTFAIAYKHIQFERDTIYDGSHKVENKTKLDANAKINILALNYGLTDSTNLKIIVPHKHIEATAQLGPQKMDIDNNGIGDMVVLLKYGLTTMSNDGYLLSIEGGVKFPTGATDYTPDDGPPFMEHSPLPTQMGTGKAEYKAGVGLTKIFNTTRVDMHTMYTYRPKAKNDYDFGNELTYTLSVVQPLSNTFNAGVEYNGKYNSDTDMGHDVTEDKNIQQIIPFKAYSGISGYITPQIQYVPFGKPKLHFTAGVSILAHYHVSEPQPLEKTRYAFRIGYMF